MHELLQHLPGVPDGARAAAGAAWLAQTVVAAAEREVLLGQVLGVIGHPELAPLFGPAGRAEQPVSGLVAGQVISGVVDRMAVLADTVLVADFKTGRAAPGSAAKTPVRYLRQLAAYRAVLRGAFPGRVVRCWLVWTEGAAAVELPGALLDAHAPGVLALSRRA